MSSEPPLGSFVKVNTNVYVASPELLFLQMAMHFDFVDLALFGMELCGTYTIQNSTEMGFFNCPAATSKTALAAFLRRAKGMRGCAVAERALKWVIDGSNSPAESALALFVSLPPRKGGYGMPKPELNPKTPLGKRASAMLGQEAMRCDLHWTSKQVVLEYNSSLEHLNPLTAAQDAKRANTLGYRNVTLLTVTPQTIAHPAEFDSLVRQLAKALDKRPSRNAFVLSVARRDLRERLFPWIGRRASASLANHPFDSPEEEYRYEFDPA